MQCAAWKCDRPSLVQRVVHQHPPLRLRWRFWPGRALYLSQSLGICDVIQLFTIISAFQNPVIFALAVPRGDERKSVMMLILLHGRIIMLFLCCLSARLFFEIINFYLCRVDGKEHSTRMKMLCARREMYFIILYASAPFSDF